MQETPVQSLGWVGKIPWRRERLPTPVFWPGEFHGLYSPWGRRESDMTFTKEDTASKHTKRCSTPPIIRKSQTKTTKKYQYTPTRMGRFL